MRIFIAGGSGALGRRLIPLLSAAGHHVIATTRTAAKTAGLVALGAEAVVMDGLDRDAAMQAVRTARPDVVVHEMTALANLNSFRNPDRDFALTNRLRTEGTDYLLAAAKAAGASRFVAQSYSGWPNERVGGRVKTEADPLDPNPPQTMRQTFAAIRHVEETVSQATGITGVVLRYGGFYGPGTSLSIGSSNLETVRRRQFPIIGDGAGVWSFLHIDDAARATMIAIERGPAGIYNIVDDEPAEVSMWLPDLANAIGAPPPRHMPALIGRLVAGEAGLLMMTKVRGSSNAKAKRALNWEPIYKSWREGFRHGLTEDAGTVPFRKAG